MLTPEDLVFVGVCDLSGHVRGKGMALADLAARAARGVGIVPSAIMMSAFGPIQDTPYGTAGDLALVPDLATLVDVGPGGVGGLGERFCLGDIVGLDGAGWACCPRGFLRRALAALRDEAGLGVVAAFEQEFVLRGVSGRAASYRLRAFREAGRFGGLLVAALRQAGVTPEGFMAEYGPGQYEVTVGPKPGLRAADEAVITRELVRAVAGWCAAAAPDPGGMASLAPMLAPDGIGNGTHIHLSLLDRAGRPALCDAGGRALSEAGRWFAGGVQRHLAALCALTAPSVASYYRLTPGRWAPTQGDLAWGDRGAALRVCPVFPGGGAPAAQFNLEFRAGDATASPYLALGGLVWAGLDGVRRRLEPAVGAAPLPGSLGEALAALQASAAGREWMGDELMRAYLMLKRAEEASLAGLEPREVCARYADAY